MDIARTTAKILVVIVQTQLILEQVVEVHHEERL